MKMTARNSIYPESSTYHMNVQPQKTKTMLNESNMTAVLKDPSRDVYQNNTDFGSTFTKHPKNYHQFYDMSEYKGNFAQQEDKGRTSDSQMAGGAKAIRQPLCDVFSKHDSTLASRPDNANSIPIEDGSYNHQNKYTGTAEFRHIRCDITNIKNKIIGHK